MERLRSGNDIRIQWSIIEQSDEGERPYDLENKALSLYLQVGYRRIKVEDFAVAGNRIIWTFYGKDQHTVGRYSIILIENEGEEGMWTIDIPDILELVPKSSMVGGIPRDDIELQVISLESTLNKLILVDSELSETSTYPVMNRVVTLALNQKATKLELSEALTTVWASLNKAATKEELNTQVRLINEALAGKISVADFDKAIASINNELNKKADKKVVDDALSSVWKSLNLAATKDELRSVNERVSDLAIDLSVGLSQKADAVDLRKVSDKLDTLIARVAKLEVKVDELAGETTPSNLIGCAVIGKAMVGASEISSLVGKAIVGKSKVANIN